MEKIRFIDLFCGIGGFRVGMDQACIENDLIPECVFSSDIDTSWIGNPTFIYYTK
jgi:DNA (cytosine-5)-methyltransferase 1